MMTLGIFSLANRDGVLGWGTRISKVTMWLTRASAEGRCLDVALDLLIDVCLEDSYILMVHDLLE